MDNIALDGSGARGGTVDRLVKGLREGILTSRYRPGQRLKEVDLTRDFRVSRGPLREAFRRLTAEGLLEIVPNRGALVRRLSHMEIVELQQIRGALEPLAARLAAGAIDQGDNRQRFETAIAPIWSEAPRLDSRYHEENRLFHTSVLEVCGNAQLVDISRQLQLPLIMLQLSDAMEPGTNQDSVRQHREIATAIVSGDGDAAENAMRRHLAWASHIVDAMARSIVRVSQGQ